jgi:hypothetical protein
MFHGDFLYYVQGTYDSSRQVNENNVALEVILVKAFVKQGNPIVKIFVMVRVFIQSHGIPLFHAVDCAL